MLTFQQIILRLQEYWGENGCALLQPYDMEVGAGTSHTATFLRAIGPEPWKAAYVQPSRRPKDGRYGENPNRLQHYYQYQVVLKPSPLDILDLYIGSLAALGIDPKAHDIRFVEDDWENPTLGAWGLGWEVWLNGMEITQFTYFQQVGGLDCKPITGEITYGIERLAMYLQDVENVFDLVWTAGVTYRDVYHQNEVEQSTYNFEQSNAAMLFEHFGHYEAEAKRLMQARLALPAYEMVLKAAHTFNLLDARGAISVTERAAYMGRIRNLARSVSQAYFDSRLRQDFPMCAPGQLQRLGIDLPALKAAAREREIGMSASLLVELFTEELPPKALQHLGAAFADRIVNVLVRAQLKLREPRIRIFATPRRLAVLIPDVLAKAPDRGELKKLMPTKVAFGADGKLTAALAKRLEKEGGSADQLERKSEGNTEYVFLNQTIAGMTLTAGLQIALNEAIAKLPIPKVMSYQLADGATTVQFVRPAHGLIALHGDQIIDVSVLGLQAGRITHGHRFQGAKDITVATADAYEDALAAHGQVIASFDSRRADVARQLADQAANLNATLGPEPDYAALLDEVTALVEFPTVYAGEFEPEFLAVPQECLILTMRQNQRYFPLFDASGRLTNRFLIVSNMRLADPRNIVEGNQRVIRPRLADARFFFETDKKIKLADRVPRLASIVYHNKLGSQLDRVERVRRLASTIAGLLGADPKLADRAGLLAKADLITNMVGEFPELQGIMGRYYALADGEDPRVADAIEQHYRPRFAGDKLPEHEASDAVALADKLESLAGMFGIGQQPSGDRDPFALRRHALGVIRILIERGLSLSLHDLVRAAFGVFPGGMLGDAHGDLQVFIWERLRGYLRDAGYTANEVESVLCMNPARLDQVPLQLAAVRAFSSLPEAESLAAANKRVVNILKQAEAKGERFANAKITGLKEPAEQALFDALNNASQQATSLFEQGDFTGYLKTFAVLKSPVDAFFDSVMVMVDSPELRHNRLALLADLRKEMNRVADISKLAA